MPPKKPPTATIPRKPKTVDPRHVEMVADQLAACKPVREIERELLATGWAADRAAAIEIVKMAYDALHELGKVVVNRRDQYRDALLEVYRKAMDSDPPALRAAVAAMDRLIKLDAVDAPTRAEVEISAPGAAQAVRERMAKLLGDPTTAARVLARFGLPVDEN